MRKPITVKTLRGRMVTGYICGMQQKDGIRWFCVPEALNFETMPLTELSEYEIASQEKK